MKRKKDTNNVFLIILLLVFNLVLISCTQAENNDRNQIYTAKLALEGICLNNVFVMEKEEFNKDLVEDWTHPETGILYKNAFAIKNPCMFPAAISKGQTFNFIILNSNPPNDCIVCLAFSPIPSKALYIQVKE